MADSLGKGNFLGQPLKVTEWMLERAKDFFTKERSINWKVVAPLLLLGGTGLISGVYLGWDSIKFWLPDAWREKAEEFMNQGKEKIKEKAVEVAQAALDRAELDLQATDGASFAGKKNIIARILNTSIKALLALNDPAAIEQFLDDNGFSAGVVREKEIPGKNGATFIISFDTGAKKFDLQEGVTAPPTSEIAQREAAQGLLMRDSIPDSISAEILQLLKRDVVQRMTVLEIANIAAKSDVDAKAEIQSRIGLTDPDSLDAMLKFCRSVQNYVNDDFLSGRLSDAEIRALTVPELFKVSGQHLRLHLRLKNARTLFSGNIEKQFQKTYALDTLDVEAFDGRVAEIVASTFPKLRGHESEFVLYCKRNAAEKVSNCLAGTVPEMGSLDTSVVDGIKDFVRWASDPSHTNFIITDPLVLGVTDAGPKITEALSKINFADALQLFLALQECIKDGAYPTNFASSNKMGGWMLIMKVVDLLCKTDHSAIARALLRAADI
jgi:hypothetical protein